MDQLTIQQLLQLNQEFYEKIAQPFADSRQQPWEGWSELFSRGLFTPHYQPWHILDLGCGNGRFLQFLASVLKSEKLEYLGIDQNKELLELAQRHAHPENFLVQFQELDFFMNMPSVTAISQQPFDLIALFGVLHHLPSKELRKAFFSQLHTLLKTQGKIIFTTWQFLDNQRLKEKIVDPITVGISKEKLEENDYILDWQRGPAAYRYCHYYSESEMKELLKATNWKVNQSFLADGHDHQTNCYFIIEAA